MLTTLSLTLLVAHSVVGSGHPAPARGRCGVCGEWQGKILAEIIRLQTSPRTGSREDAAHDLRKFNWRCHPEIVNALAVALMKDREEEVREEAAKSLTHMGACTPLVHAAMTRAAQRDTDHATRREARKGLKAFGRRCAGECVVCGPISPVTTPISPPVEPMLLVPGMPPGIDPPPIRSDVVPPVDAPPIPPGPSPFSTNPIPLSPPEPEPILRPLSLRLERPARD